MKILAGIIVFGATVAFSAPVESAPMGSVVLDTCGNCYGTSTMHAALENHAPLSDYSEGHGWHNNYYTLSCGIHGICVWGEEEEDLETVVESVIQAAALDRTDKLARLLESPLVEANLDRDAIQIVGCDGESIVAHVPVSPGVQLALLAD